MQIKILAEFGYKEALIGISRSYNQMGRDMNPVVSKLLKRDLNGGELKFLEQIMVWVDITAPRYFWQQFDTYRVGVYGDGDVAPNLADCGYKINVPKQSDSTMHTILKRPLTQEDFEQPIYEETLDRLNRDIAEKNFHRVKENLPESFLQGRTMVINYKTLINIMRQRDHHKLPVWQYFNNYFIENLEQKEIIKELVLTPKESVTFHKDELAILKEFDFDFDYVLDNIDTILEENSQLPFPLQLGNLKRNLKYLLPD